MWRAFNRFGLGNYPLISHYEIEFNVRNAHPAKLNKKIGAFRKLLID